MTWATFIPGVGIVLPGIRSQKITDQKTTDKSTDAPITVKTHITIIWGPNSLQPRIWEHNSHQISLVLSSLLKILDDLRT